MLPDDILLYMATENTPDILDTLSQTVEMWPFTGILEKECKSECGYSTASTITTVDSNDTFEIPDEYIVVRGHDLVRGRTVPQLRDELCIPEDEACRICQWVNQDSAHKHDTWLQNICNHIGRVSADADRSVLVRLDNMPHSIAVYYPRCISKPSRSVERLLSAVVFMSVWPPSNFIVRWRTECSSPRSYEDQCLCDPDAW